MSVLSAHSQQDPSALSGVDLFAAAKYHPVYQRIHCKYYDGFSWSWDAPFPLKFFGDRKFQNVV